MRAPLRRHSSRQKSWQTKREEYTHSRGRGPFNGPVRNRQLFPGRARARKRRQKSPESAWLASRLLRYYLEHSTARWIVDSDAAIARGLLGWTAGQVCECNRALVAAGYIRVRHFNARGIKVRAGESCLVRIIDLTRSGVHHARRYRRETGARRSGRQRGLRT